MNYQSNRNGHRKNRRNERIELKARSCHVRVNPTVVGGLELRGLKVARAHSEGEDPWN